MAKTLNIPASVSNSAKAKNQFFLKRLINNFLAKRQAKKVMKAIHEAEQIHAGRKKGTTFNEFIHEL